MRHDDTAEPDWRPLETLARICHAHPELPDLDPGAFMHIGRHDEPDRAPILLYKHTLTRRYLNVDHAGHAYRYTPSPSGAQRYEPIPDLGSALAWVQGASTTPVAAHRPAAPRAVTRELSRSCPPMTTASRLRGPLECHAGVPGPGPERAYGEA